MTFIEKLISDTKNGNLDYVWKYNGGGKTYTYNLKKDPMNGLSIDALKKDNNMIFPNGFAVGFNRNDLNLLLDAINESLSRTCASTMSDYLERDLASIQSNDNSTDNTEVNNEDNLNSENITSPQQNNKENDENENHKID